jgi:hypothetical protein
MFARKTTAARLFGLDAGDWLVLLVGLALAGIFITLLRSGIAASHRGRNSPSRRGAMAYPGRACSNARRHISVCLRSPGTVSRWWDWSASANWV